MTKVKLEHPVLKAMDERRRAVLKVLRAIAGMEPNEARDILKSILEATPERSKA